MAPGKAQPSLPSGRPKPGAKSAWRQDLAARGPAHCGPRGATHGSMDPCPRQHRFFGEVVPAAAAEAERHRGSIPGSGSVPESFVCARRSRLSRDAVADRRPIAPRAAGPLSVTQHRSLQGASRLAPTARAGGVGRHAMSARELEHGCVGSASRLERDRVRKGCAHDPLVPRRRSRSAPARLPSPLP